jgi:hypothetical protein
MKEEVAKDYKEGEHPLKAEPGKDLIGILNSNNHGLVLYLLH